MEHQKPIITGGGIAPLVAMLKGGSVSAQAFAAQALANAAMYSKVEGQDAIAAAGALPVLLTLLAVGKAQMPAAAALAKLASNNPAIQKVIAEEGGIAPLLSLLNGRNTDAQVQAAAALSELSRGNSETQAAIAKAGGIGPLLALVSSRSAAAQAQSMSALGQLAHQNRENQDTIARMGGIKPLVGLLDLNGDRNVQACSAAALMEITRSNAGNQQTVVDNGGISHLAALSKTSQNANVKTAAAGALWSLSEDPMIKVAIAGAGTIPPLVELLGGEDELAVMHASKALASLGLNNSDNQVQITQLLIDLLSMGSEAGQDRAVRALQTLVTENRRSHDVIAQAGNPESLVDLLKKGMLAAKDYALWSLSLSISATNQEIVAASGGVQPLIDQLGDGRVFTREQAALALSKIAHNNEATRSKVTASGGVTPLIRQLDASGGATSELLRQNASSALADLSIDPVARDEIVGAGGIRPLVLLLQDEGRDTKKFAAMALARLSKDHEATQSAIAEAGAIAPLVALLDGLEGGEAQQEAAGALFALADHERNRLAITEADGIGWLVSLLGSENPSSRQHAEGALVRLSIENANRVLIIKKLVDMLQDTGNAAQEQAAAALANLARESEDNRKSIVEANGIPPLLALLDTASAKAKENSVGAIKQLCRKSKENQLQIAKAGGIPKLVGVLLSFSTQSQKAAEISAVQLCTLAAEAIKEMAKGNRKNQDAIAEAGAIQPLVSLLASQAPQMQASAAGALANIARNNQVQQASVAKTGAVAPLCTLIREGSPETKDSSASALWSIATDNALNKDTIAKLGGIDPLVGLLTIGESDKSQEYVAGALAALAHKHLDNRQLIAKRLVGLLGSSAARAPEKAVRVLMTCSSFSSDHAANQIAIMKAGGIPPLISWLGVSSVRAQAHAAHALFCLAQDNSTTQVQIARSDGIPPLIALVRRSSPQGQEHAARALWHLASQKDNQAIIVESQGIKPLVGMLLAEGDSSAELASLLVVRLTHANSEVALLVAERGGIVPLVKLLTLGTEGARQQAAAALGELALVSRNRDSIASAGGIEPLVRLLDSSTLGTPEMAARALSHLAREDTTKADDEANESRVESRRQQRRGSIRAIEAVVDEGVVEEIRGPAQRRAKIKIVGGIKSLISMVAGSKDAKKKVWAAAANVFGMNSKDKGSGLPGEAGMRMGMQEQAAGALADLAHDSPEMQDAIIEANGVSPLLTFIRMGSQVGQEHAARAIWHLAALNENQGTLVDCGTIPELVMLLKNGTPKAKEVSAAGISDLARGAVVEWQARQEQIAMERAAQAALAAAATPSSSVVEVHAPPTSEILPVMSLHASPHSSPLPHRSSSVTRPVDNAAQQPPSTAPEEGEDKLAEGEPTEDEEAEPSERLVSIAEAGGILPLVALLTIGTTQARENAAGALWHLAIDPSNQINIAKVNGIAPLVTMLDDGTVQAHKHAADALARLAIKNPDNQLQIAKHLVGLLGNTSAGAQCRAAHALRELAADNPGSPVVIVNAGAISPLVALLSTGATEVKEEAAGALSMLALNSPANQLAIATGLVVLLGVGSAEAQEHVTQLLLTLSHDTDNRLAIAKAGAIQRLIVQLRGGGETSTKAQELAAAVLARLSGDSSTNTAAIATASGIRPLVALLVSESPQAQAYASAVLSDMARSSKRNRNTILSEGGITPLVSLLENKNHPQAKAEAAGALLCLSEGYPETQKVITDAGAIMPLVNLLSEEYDPARRKAAGAIAALSRDSIDNQDAVQKHDGISKLVGLLGPEFDDEVRADAAAALGVLAQDNKNNQDTVASVGGIDPLVSLLHRDTAQRAKEEAASALWSLVNKHNGNQVAVADGNGIAPLVAVLGLGSARTQEQAAGALAALALDNTKNELSIAELVVTLLDSEDKQVSAKAGLAISRLARAHRSNQTAIAGAGGVTLLVNLFDIEDGGVGRTTGEDADLQLQLELALVQKEMCNAIWSMAHENPDNQAAIAKANGIPPLIALLSGHPEVHREAAGALWSLAANKDNQLLIAREGGIAPFVTLLKEGSLGAQETAAGSMYALAEADENRISIADAGGILPLVALFDCGSDEAKEQAAGALRTLVLNNTANQLAVALGLVSVFASGSADAQEHVTKLLRNLAQDPENRFSITKAGAVPKLVQQLEHGTEKSMPMAHQALILIATGSANHRATVTQELVKLLASEEEAVRQRASEALRGVQLKIMPSPGARLPLVAGPR